MSDDTDQLSDDAAIAMAILLGCEFFVPPGAVRNNNDIFINQHAISSGLAHPLEVERSSDLGPSAYGWTSKAELARDLIAWHIRQKRETP